MKNRRDAGRVCLATTLAWLLSARAVTAQRVYWAQTLGDRVQRINLDGSGWETLVEPPAAFDPVAVRVDVLGGKLYWAETFGNTIRRANLDGTGMQTILQPPAVFSPAAIDLDVTGNPPKVYWIRGNDDVILRANLDGSVVETLVGPPNSFDVVALAVDANCGWLYWAENPGNRIRRAALDGSNVTTFLDVIFVSDPVALTVDERTCEVYWAERASDRIRRSDGSGLGVQTIVDSVFVNDPVALTLISPARNPYTGAILYWAEGATHRIREADPELGVRTVTESPIVFGPVALDVDPRRLPPTPVEDAVTENATRSLALSVPVHVLAGPGGPSPQPTALRVKIVDLQTPIPPNSPGNPPPNYSAFEAGSSCSDLSGCVRWVGPVGTFKESNDNALLGTFRAARLQCTPYYFDWSSVGIFNVVGAEIIPSSKYDVENLAATCPGVESICGDISSPLRITTARWGDVAPPFDPPSASVQPDGLDVVALVNKFKFLPGAPRKAGAQLQSNSADPLGDIDGIDIALCVDAFKGLAYPYSGPCPCPSTVVCDLTPCSSTAACGSGTCVRSCSGGGLNGQVCRANEDCPNGVCGAAFCRDRCLRCGP